MRYVVVNDRIPFMGYCALCTHPVEAGYVHELSTNLYYCSYVHYKGACEMAVLAIEDHARRVS